MRAFALAALWCVACGGIAGAGEWPVFGHDPARSGVDGSRPSFSVATVGKLRERWQISLGAAADSTPILLGRNPSAGRPAPMLFVTDESGATYGIDALSGAIRWRFVTHGPPRITNSTPAAGPDDRTVYAPGIDGFVHALDSASGRELRVPGFPARITTMPATEKDASALNVANGYLYATTSGYIGDAPPYDGHVVSVRLSDGATHVFNSLCSRRRALPAPSSCAQQRSGIWSRGGAVVDPDPAMGGRIYAATGNGDFDANAGGDDYGDSVVSLAGDTLDLLGSYTPANYANLDAHDGDLGSTNPALLPRQPRSRTPLMLVQGGKDRILRLLDRSALPGVGGELQRLDVGHLFASPAVWSDPSGRAWIFLGLRTSVEAFRLVTNAAGTSALVRAWRVPLGAMSGEGSSPVVSGGVVFAAEDGAILALDAVTGRRLWSSAQPSAGRTIGPIHWESPIAVDGWLYCTDEDRRLTAYAAPV